MGVGLSFFQPYGGSRTPTVRLDVSKGKFVLGGCDPDPPGGVDLDSVGCDKEPVLCCLGDQPCLCKGQKHTGSSDCAHQIGAPMNTEPL